MTTATLDALAHDVGVEGDPDPSTRPRRRSHTAEYKEPILAEYDAVPVGSPERGARVFCERFFDHYNHMHRSHGVRDCGVTWHRTVV